MALLELIFIAVGLSMDAFAVAVCKGLGTQKATIKEGIIIGTYFGVFQAGMPFIGYILGVQFAGAIQTVDHWVAFILLSLIGAKMLYESLKKDEAVIEESCAKAVSPRAMLPLAVATSIDALAIGVSFAFLNVSILPAILLIGCITFALSVCGFKIGDVFGTKHKAKAEFAGGIILMLMGLKILLEHTGVL